MTQNLTEDYQQFVQELKQRICNAQIKAAFSVNQELVLLYWQIGREIVIKQQQQGWGAKVIDRLSGDLRSAFPQMKGFSSRNLKYMRKFAQTYPKQKMVQEVLAQITWYHNLTLMEKVKSEDERLWYIHRTIENGWSRNILVHQIESDLYHRQGKAITNFERTLPSGQSELAQQLLKDPYNFDFLGLGKDAQERDLEKALIEHIRDFLLELGIGFSWVGSQYHLEVGGEDFYLDLLFYHLELRCFVVIELKIGKFQPEFSGKMNFYLSAVDNLLRHPDDAPSIGIILCKAKNETIVEYALREMNKPIGVSTYQLTEALPEKLHGSLPTIEQLEEQLEAIDNNNDQSK